MRLNFEGPDFVYSLCSLNGGMTIASAGETTGVKIFSDGKFRQTLPIPALSAWCVRFLNNGDITVGCSDNRIYIFTMDEGRKASPEIIALYDAEIARFQQPQQAMEQDDDDDDLPEEVGGVKLVDMPGPEALRQPGKRDGQTMMVTKMFACICIYRILCDMVLCFYRFVMEKQSRSTHGLKVCT